MRLNQVIALVSGKKARVLKKISDAHHGWKDGLLSGIVRVYTPKNEDGEKFPSESKQVQIRVLPTIGRMLEGMSDFYDCVLTQECANQLARADVVVGGETLLAGLPVTTILFLEKQVVDLLAFARNLPVLSSDKVWHKDSAKDCFVSEYEETTKTRKVLKALVKYEATAEHPAQTETYNVDEVIGHWKTLHLSGAVTAEYKDEVIQRLCALQDALKSAREEANSVEIDMKCMGENVFSFVFGM